MTRRNRNNSNSVETFTIWTSFTDLMSNAFMIITLLLLFVIARSSASPQDKHLSKPEKNNNNNNSKPTIISLPSNKYSFPSGSAVLPDNLQDDISKNGQDGIILQLIQKNIAELEKNDKQVDVIEIIGHTDGQAVGSLKCNNRNSSNLDKELENVSTGNKQVSILCPSSNADLGLMRALAVVKELQKAQKNKQSGRFKQLQFRAYSAAQLLLPDDQGFAAIDRNANWKRRRIEIRFAQVGDYVTPDNNP
ncbi:flagellar motor protein [Anabaena sp. FACHB-1237]|uniref:flagellar motor protein n=1 Tax=Anabaena sp. FACHB-1237 TaxID=2692769 RepID=UPI0016819D61|nr:flagellar motor protein [Anabaena sp. FACHB-1237]MBD2137546.1 flagellar motor protein [Anabaena sp. FACHB-1237]